MAYFDHNATTPLTPLARDAWLRASAEHWHNPSSLYRDGAKAKIRLDNARKTLAQLLGASDSLLIFNSGATESAHAALAYLASHASTETPIVVNRTEHPAVLAAAERAFGPRIRWLDTDAQGVVDDAKIAVLASGSAGVVVMAANNETGVLQPWAKIQAVCRRLQVPYLCDASQWCGKISAAGLGGVDWLIGSGHKFGGPKGVGFLKIPASAHDFSSQPGGNQESGHRGGTENLPSAWAMTDALEEAEQAKVLFESQRLDWRQTFEREIESLLPGAVVIAKKAERLWNTVSLQLPFGESQRWVTKLDKLGFQVSAGSACTSGKPGPSHVLTAMGLSAADTRNVIRISAGWETTPADWSALANAVVKVAAELQPNLVNVISPR